MSKTVKVGTAADVPEVKATPEADSAYADKMAALQTEISNLVGEYNQYVQLAHGKKMQETAKTIKEKVDAYKEASKENFAAQCRVAADPMAAALKLMSYPVIKTSIKNDAESGLDLMSWEVGSAQVDLEWLNKKLGGIGADATWLGKAKKLNKVLAEIANTSLGKPIEDFNAQYKIREEDDAVEGFKSTGSTTLTVKGRSLKDDLTTVVVAMIGENFRPLVTEDAVAYIEMSHTARKRGGAIATTRDRTFIEALATICARLMYSDDPTKAFVLKLGQQKKQK